MTAANPQQVNLSFSNRQRTRPLNLRWLKGVVETLFVEFSDVERVDLSICIVGAADMARLNETFLQHKGSTDVITFDYLEAKVKRKRVIHGEIFVCLDDAMVQAREFKTSWQAEIVRYIVHGILHLLGHDDHGALPRRKMKREENRLMKLLAARFALSDLGRKSKVGA